MNNSEIVERFFDGATKGKNYTSNLYIEDRILYSYGTHFPLAVRLPNRKYIMNADRYSHTTSIHQRLCWKHHPAMTSFGMLDQIFAYSAEKLAYGNILILDQTENVKEIKVYRHIITSEIITREQRNNMPRMKAINYHLIYETRPGGLILRYIDYDKARYFLASMDGNQYFISELPEPVVTVERAFEILKPKEIGNQEFKRQGEWFFVELPIEEKEVRKIWKVLKPKFILPMENNQSNPHTCTRGGFVMNLPEPIKGLRADQIIVGGQINHPEHRQLKLNVIYKKEWKLFVAYENNAINSWSAGRYGINID